MALRLLTRGFPTKPPVTWIAFLDRLRRLGSNAAAGVPIGYLLSGKDLPAGVMITPATRRGRGDGSHGLVINLSSWYVEPDERWRAGRMLQNILKQHEAMFTDLTPTTEVQAMLPVFGFVPTNTGVLLTALPMLAALRADSARVTPLTKLHAPLLPDGLYEWLEAHCALGCIAALLETEHGRMPLLFRRRMLKGVPAAKLIYCTDHTLLQAALPAVARYLMKRGILLLMSDDYGLPLRTGQAQRKRGLKFARPGDGLGLDSNSTDHTASELALLDL